MRHARTSSGLAPGHPFLRFAERQFASSDFDAPQPVLIELGRSAGLDREQGIWLTLLQMAHHNEGSAWAAFNASEPFGDLCSSYPIESARRNLFGGRINDHFASMRASMEPYGSGEAWLTNGFTDDPVENWCRLLDTLRGVWGNGRWAAYTSADMLQKVNGLKVCPPDVDNAGSTGPADGLRYLFGTCEGVAALDAFASRAFDALRAQVPIVVPYLPTGHLDMGMLESLLCEWSSMCRGVYYSGRNIDRQQERITHVTMKHGLMLDEVWSARKAAYQRRHLGEYGGWAGIDKVRLTHYARTGIVLWSHEGR